MSLEFDDEALLEAEDARDHYAAIEPFLGDAFAKAFDQAIESIVSTPMMWSPYTGRTRRYVMTRFPYSVIYRVRGDVVRVLALTHQSRRPSYWRRR